ncbi:hypothetical protein [Spirosoma endbachense]|uniref:Uncharacterized protein n=1 Tax=Spirosoma endbachense TaxID=2666025 RepID=A0A6P1VZ21_9BACT|nr:hypothetical protein [Spirosoma endbachense]QHV97864.1 hypothetical protein GJR95_23920 [Spirosoma endbachense]
MSEEEIRIVVAIDFAEQEMLWEELGNMAWELVWGKERTEFIKDAKEEFILVKKPPNLE